MSVDTYVTVTELSGVQDYKLAEAGDGYVVPGADFLAAISPRQPISYIALLRFAEGEPRANHYHEKKTEYLVVLDGTLRGIFYLLDDPENEIEMTISAGSMVEIQPGCVHLFSAVDGSATVLEMSPQKLDLNDQVRMY